MIINFIMKNGDANIIQRGKFKYSFLKMFRVDMKYGQGYWRHEPLPGKFFIRKRNVATVIHRRYGG